MFLEHYLAEFALQHEGYDEAKLLDILSKTLRKMSLAGRQAAQGLISAPAEVAPLLEKAVNRETQNVKRVSNARDSGGDSRSSLRVSAVKFRFAIHGLNLRGDAAPPGRGS